MISSFASEALFETKAYATPENVVPCVTVSIMLRSCNQMDDIQSQCQQSAVTCFSPLLQPPLRCSSHIGLALECHPCAVLDKVALHTPVVHPLTAADPPWEVGLVAEGIHPLCVY
jgi:hypothetical protein